MVAPCYFKSGWDREKLEDFQEEILEAKERLIEEFKVDQAACMKIWDIYPYAAAFLGKIYNGLKNMLFYKDNI
jgi:DNA-directed RNA polymerase subunit F